MRSPHDLCLSLSATRKVISMMANSLRGRFAFGHALRLLGVAASLFALSVVANPRAEALSPVNPGSRAPGKAAANELTIEVRGGHGGSGGGHSGGYGGGRSYSGTFVRSGTYSTGPAVVARGTRFAGHGFAHRHRFRGVFIGGVYYDDYPYDYPDDDYPADYPAVGPGFVAAPGCRAVVTADGPRVVCHHRAARHTHAHWRHHQRRHHHA
jgi:hypothetical protein